MIQRMLCPECGEDVLKQSFSEWNPESQKWEGNEMTGPDAGYWCRSCGDIERVDNDLNLN